MKFIVALCALVLVFCFIGEAKAGDELESTVKELEEPCVGITFSDDGTSATQKTCSLSVCSPGKKAIVTEDRSKPYPDCCPVMECVDEV